MHRAGDAQEAISFDSFFNIEGRMPYWNQLAAIRFEVEGADVACQTAQHSMAVYKHGQDFMPVKHAIKHSHDLTTFSLLCLLYFMSNFASLVYIATSPMTVVNRYISCHNVKPATMPVTTVTLHSPHLTASMAACVGCTLSFWKAGCLFPACEALYARGWICPVILLLALTGTAESNEASDACGS